MQPSSGGTFLALAVLFAGTAWGAAPSYSAASIVNAGSYTAAPFAPNSIVSIFGTELSYSVRELRAEDIRGGVLPTELANTQVLVDGYQAPLFYVSPTQINFLISSRQSIGTARIQVMRQAIYGPAVTVNIVDGAPALFQQTTQTQYVIATSADSALLTPEAPAHAGDIVVLYLTGLGKTDPNPDLGEVSRAAANIIHRAQLTVWLGGIALDPARIQYAGLTPGCAGLYQINFVLPDKTGNDPEIQVSIGSQTSGGGLKLPVR